MNFIWRFEATQPAHDVIVMLFVRCYDDK